MIYIVTMGCKPPWGKNKQTVQTLQKSKCLGVIQQQ